MPIQQDETALVVWALRRHFEVFRDVEFIREVHRDLVSKPADWILSFRDHNGLPQPSWDLWEERYGVHLFTVATCIGALEASRDFADDFGAAEESAKYGSAIDQMRAAMIKHMWCEETGHFARTVTLQEDGTYTRDMTLDASAWGLFAFNALPPQDPRVASHMEAVRARLTVDTEIGGVARYENDYYHQVESTDTNRVPGNPWAICTLWMAQYDIAIATTVEQSIQRWNNLFFTAHDTGQNHGIAGDVYTKRILCNCLDQVVRDKERGFFAQNINYKQKHLINTILIYDLMH